MAAVVVNANVLPRHLHYLLAVDAYIHLGAITVIERLACGQPGPLSPSNELTIVCAVATPAKNSRNNTMGRTGRLRTNHSARAIGHSRRGRARRAIPRRTI